VNAEIFCGFKPALERLTRILGKLKKNSRDLFRERFFGRVRFHPNIIPLKFKSKKVAGF
jgi:hypothetical protein